MRVRRLRFRVRPGAGRRRAGHGRGFRPYFFVPIYSVREVIIMAVRKSVSSIGTASHARAGKPATGNAVAEPAAVPDRQRRIEERAYYKAAQRGFIPGNELQDWLEAESEEEEESEEA